MLFDCPFFKKKGRKGWRRKGLGEGFNSTCNVLFLKKKKDLKHGWQNNNIHEIWLISMCVCILLCFTFGKKHKFLVKVCEQHVTVNKNMGFGVRHLVLLFTSSTTLAISLNFSFLFYKIWKL